MKRISKKNSRPKGNNIYLFLLLALILAVMIPHVGTQSYLGEGIVDSEVAYRDGLFGPVHRMVTDENGIRMHVIDYPWYTFKSASSMNIYGIEGSSTSNDISLVLDKNTAYKDLTFKQQNDLYFPDSIWNKYPKATKSKLVMYEGLPKTNDYNFGIGDHSWAATTVDGPWNYGDTWTTTLRYYPKSTYLEAGNTYDYTVQETIYIDSPIPGYDKGYDTDRAFVHITIPKDSSSGNVDSATLKVTVLDNLLQMPAEIQLYKDGKLYRQSNQLKDGSITYKDLPFGTYSVKVLNADYETFFYDAYPAQPGYSYDRGQVELSKVVNTCNYLIYGISEGTKQSGASGFDDPDNDIPSTKKIVESFENKTGISLPGGGGDGLFTAFFNKLITTLVAITILGLPVVFIVIAVWLYLKWKGFSLLGNKSSGMQGAPGGYSSIKITKIENRDNSLVFVIVIAVFAAGFFLSSGGGSVSSGGTDLSFNDNSIALFVLLLGIGMLVYGKISRWWKVRRYQNRADQQRKQYPNKLPSHDYRKK